ncbi:transposon Ty3-I Gag-Pol polyprotein [Nephila pilipes]|uniref:Transposon Ty3-I Gag-Pol polyprotein n=1 Tax=Nephila pilipes TaxID=299642 RepID=A0A8X6NDP5_NEPPI|nr:transposon Ty3-I Gag-Pol polyprotein [Nephila pilipes]
MTSLSSIGRIVSDSSSRLTTTSTDTNNLQIKALLEEFKYLTIQKTQKNVDLLYLRLYYSIFAYFGHKINNSGIEPITERIKIIKEFLQPTTVRDLRKLLGIINFYQLFIPNVAKHQAILNDYLKGPKGNDKNEIQWSEESVRVGQATNSLSNLPFSFLCTLAAVMDDASDTAIGGVIQQKVNDVWKPLTFFSSRLTPTQTRYSTYDGELLAVYSTIKHFRYLLEGREFTLFTDHRP